MASAAVNTPPKTLFDVRQNARHAFARWRPYLGYRAEQVKAFAQRYYEQHGIEPTYTQVCDACDIPTKGEVSRIVAGLERRGEIVRVDGFERDRRCLDKPARPRMKVLNR